MRSTSIDVATNPEPGTSMIQILVEGVDRGRLRVNHNYCLLSQPRTDKTWPWCARSREKDERGRRMQLIGDSRRIAA